MTTSKLSSDANMPDETLFIRNSLAAVEKSEKIHRLKLVGFRVLLVIGAGWFGFRTIEVHTLLGVECTVLIMTGLIVGVCTAQIRFQMDKNTRAILQAIAESHRR